jgi:hypothetical protein
MDHNSLRRFYQTLMRLIAITLTCVFLLLQPGSVFAQKKGQTDRLYQFLKEDICFSYCKPGFRRFQRFKKSLNPCPVTVAEKAKYNGKNVIFCSGRSAYGRSEKTRPFRQLG